MAGPWEKYGGGKKPWEKYGAPAVDPAKTAAGPVKTAEGNAVFDVLKQVPAGLAAGTAALAGLPGDVNRGIGQGIGWLRDTLIGDVTPEQRAKIEAAKEGASILPTTAGIRQAAYDVTGVALPEPTTTAGKFARTAAEFVPGAAAFGVPGKMAQSVFGLGVVPGLASEGAGEVAARYAPALEPAARLVAPLVAGGVAARAMKPKTSPAPTADELKMQSQGLYASAKGQGLMIEPASFDNLVDDIARTAIDAGIDKAIQPKAYAALERLVRSKGVGQKLEDIDILRQIAGGIFRDASAGANERRIAGLIVDKLDDFMSNLKPGDVLAGNPDAAVSAITEARSLWAKKAKAETIADIFYKAENAAGANYTRAGMETALRQQFRALANNPTKMRAFSPEERDAILKVVRGGPFENAMRLLGKFAPTGVISSTLSGGAGYAMGGPIGAVALPSIGFGARRAATNATIRNAELVDALVRGGPRSVPRPNPATTLGIAAALQGSTVPWRAP